VSSKEATIEFIRSLPDDVNLEPLLSALRRQYANSENPAESGQSVDWSADELTEDEWRQFVAHSLTDELSDPRDDIYTLEDGVPVDASQ
jgi:hypothetical protein